MTSRSIGDILAHFCGVMSQFLADMTQHKNPEDLFTVSILSNIGKLIIAVYWADSYQRLSAMANVCTDGFVFFF